MGFEVSEIEFRFSQGGIVPIQDSDFSDAVARQNDLPWVKVSVEKRLAALLILAARELVFHKRTQLHEPADPLRRKRRAARTAACLLQHDDLLAGAVGFQVLRTLGDLRPVDQGE